MASKNTALLMKQYKNLVDNIDSFTNGQGSVRLDEESDSLDIIFLTLTIKEGLFRGAVIEFKLTISEEYPQSPPIVICLTELYHPNFDFDCMDYYDENDSNVCLNLFDCEWTDELTLEDVVQGLLFLIYNPNHDDPLNSMFTGLEPDNYESLVRQTLRGGVVDDLDSREFPRALPDDYESEDEGQQEWLVNTTKSNKQESTTEVEDVLVESTTKDEATKESTITDDQTYPMIPSEPQTLFQPSPISMFRFVFGTIFRAIELVRVTYRKRELVESSVDPQNLLEVIS